MTIAVTGATGQLGHLAVEHLLQRGVPAAGVVALGRDLTRADDLAARGVQVRHADYDDPATLGPALAGVTRLLLISASEVGRRVPQHAAVIDAARTAGVELLVYTSSPNADTAAYTIAQEHRETERLLAGAGLPHVVLRNGWYLENYTDQLPVYLEHGIVGAAGDGRIAAATRADLAEAAAVVLSSDGRAGRTYSLGGPAFTLKELAQEISLASDRDVAYTDLSEEALVEVLTGAGLPAGFAAALADADAAASEGGLFVEPDDLEQLLGRPATTYAEAVRAAL
jgi:NAD(P)H dehydrogenase (quinone)